MRGQHDAATTREITARERVLCSARRDVPTALPSYLGGTTTPCDDHSYSTHGMNPLKTSHGPAGAAETQNYRVCPTSLVVAMNHTGEVSDPPNGVVGPCPLPCNLGRPL